MTLIELTEWGASSRAHLTAGERRALARFDRYLTVSYDGDAAVIGPRDGFVGSASLSDHTMIVVRPKVPVRNLVGLIGLACRTEPVPPSLGDTLLLNASDPTDWLAVLLIAEVERLASRGLRRGYVEVSAELPYVRGRLRFDTVAGLLNPSTMICEFADFVQDTTENRILRGTLELVALYPLQPLIRRRVWQLINAFDQVTVARPSLAMFDRLLVSALNRHYEPALRICKLILETAGVDTDPGEVAAPAFFLPMERIFQEAVANFLLPRLAGLRAQSSYGRLFTQTSGIPIRTIAITPDLVLGFHAGQHELVLDMKYKRASIPGRYRLTFRSDDIYQILSYSLALKCPGVLIYPRDNESISATYVVSGRRFTIVTVDLERSQLDGLETLADFLIRLASRTDSLLGASV